MLNQKILKSVLHYNPDTGVFTWVVRTSNSVKVGDVAGGLSRGYICIRVNNKIYKGHRLAWLYMTGCFPIDQIDHKNGARHDNRFCNLREATRSQNQHNVFKPTANSTSELRGVSYRKDCEKYVAHIGVDGINKYLGLFNTPEEASAAYLKAKKIYHPFAF